LEYFVDTRINSTRSISSLFISPQVLASRLELAGAPLLLDVRPQARFDASPRMLAGARRCSLEDVPELAAALYAANPQQEVVAYCVYGHHVGADAATALRAAGLTAHALAGGFEGGQDGVDSAQDIAQWRSVKLPKIVKGEK
jgi:rhodanese-related sulfurtransferase